MKYPLSIALCLVASQASAQWYFDSQGGAFDDAPLNIAITGDSYGNYGFGFRCRNKDDLEVVFGTPEQIDADAAKNISMLEPELKIRVDDGEVHSIPITAVSQNGELAAFGTVSVDVVNEVNAANRRVAVVISMLSEQFHETEFNVSGSTTVTSDLISACGLFD